MQVEKCGICGRFSAALQTCRLCRRLVCEEHFNYQEGMCSQCYGRLSVATDGGGEVSVSAVPFRLFLLGFVLMFAGVVVLIVAAWLGGGETQFSGGVILIIGFVPVVVGVGPYGFYAIVIGAILTIIAFVVFVWMRKQVSKGQG